MWVCIGIVSCDCVGVDLGVGKLGDGLVYGYEY